MNLIKNTIKADFTITPNGLIYDESLPKESRFLFIWMAGKPDDFEFTMENLAACLCWHVDTLRKYMAPLLKAGWMTRNKVRRAGGEFDTYEYFLHSVPVFVPVAIPPHPKITGAVNNGNGKNRVLNNKENPSPTPESKKSEPETSPEAWLATADERLETALAKLRNLLESQPDLVQLITGEARVKITPAEFRQEAEEWLRYNRDNYQVVMNPAKFLRGGRNSFFSWLRNPIRDKKSTQGSQKPAWQQKEEPQGGLRYDRPAQQAEAPEFTNLAKTLKA